MRKFELTMVTRQSLTFVDVAEQPCPDLMEITLFVPQGENITDFLIGAETRFGTMTIYLDDYEQYVEFGLSKATLRLTCSGCTIVPGSRFGDPQFQPVTTTIKRSNTRGWQNQNKLGLGAGATLAASKAPGASATFDATLEHSGARLAEGRETIEESTGLTSSPVAALSGNRWEFSALDRGILKAKYSGDETLCKARVTGTSIDVIADFFFFAKDIVIFDGTKSGRVLSNLLARSPTKNALCKILLGKHLATLNNKNGTSTGELGPIVGGRHRLHADSGGDQ